MNRDLELTDFSGTDERREVYAVLTGEWQTTQQVARRLGIEWAPGSHGLRPLREFLFACHLAAPQLVAHEPRHGGHRWRVIHRPARQD